MYTSLYQHADDDSKVPEVVEHLRGIYPLELRLACGHYFTITHKQRILVNHALNWLLAERHTELEFLPSLGERPGWTMQPQDMIIWKGAELLCYSRRYAKNSPVTGAVYVVQAWDGAHVTVTLHPDYVGEKLFEEEKPAEEAPEAGEVPAEADGDDEDAKSDADALEELDDTVDDKGSVQQAPGVYKLTYKRASEILRPQHALVYASIQGRTMKNSVCLMDLDNKKMTTRDIITAMSRPTTGLDLHFMSYGQQKQLLEEIDIKYRHGDFDLRKRVLESKHQEPSERPTPSRVGRC